MKNVVLFFVFGLIGLLFSSNILAQKNYFSHFTFTADDSLRGSLTPYRTCYDVHHYDLEIHFNIDSTYIKGSNSITFTAVKAQNRIQIDLMDPLQLTSISFKNFPNSSYTLKRFKNAIWIDLPFDLIVGKLYQLELSYEGKVRKAVNAPWDGGFTWTKDSEQNPWLSVSCQGIGASTWWPCKDHLSDEPDSMTMTYHVPKALKVIGNGKLVKEKIINQKRIATWHVSYPINTYNVTFYIGNYTLFTDNYNGLELNYYVLNKHLSAAKKHFEQVKFMLSVYEKFVGPYPFVNDGYKLVESPYWGMEHQSAIAYGNNFKNNEYVFDFIIIHESGHEWFGNNVSVADNADLWVHEAFTTNLEALFVEFSLGQKESIQYLNEQRLKIKNKLPIQGPKDVNFNEFGSADMYYKGSWMLHTLRSWLNNDQLWINTIKKIQLEFALKTTDAETICDFLSQELQLDLTAFFKQYLHTPMIPKLQWDIVNKKEGNYIKAKYKNVVDGFAMPIRLIDATGNSFWVQANGDANSLTKIPKAIDVKTLKVDIDFFLIE